MAGNYPNLGALGGTPREVAQAVNYLLNTPVALSKIEAIPADTIVANVTGASASPTAASAADVTAILPVFTASLNGLVPTPGATGTTLFLREDGTWAVPPGTSSGAAWGSITGTLSAQTDLQTALNAKADTSSLGYFATGTNASNLTGTVNAAQMPALSGDATTTAGSTAVTVVQASGAFAVNGGTLTVKSGGGLKMWDATNTTNVKFTFSGTTVTINQPVSITGNVTATNLSGTNTGDETSATILSKLGISAIANGTYTPTATLSLNASAATPSVWQYSRNGSVVTMSGTLTVAPTASGDTKVDLTLPIASAFTQGYQVSGSASANDAGSFVGGRIAGKPSGGAASLRFTAPSTATQTFYCVVQYLIV